jgi:hypothetical protein
MHTQTHTHTHTQIINSSILVVHGGIFHTQDALLSEMNAINRAEFSLRDMPEGGEKLQQIPRYNFIIIIIIIIIII